ncbi:MAG TPA: hypothetical protein VL460_00790 [Caulobacteraceae bacterium]|jgi:hypothetical protein|nr:hypothetical protein [Caulobacteraceae bacterium]
MEIALHYRAKAQAARQAAARTEDADGKANWEAAGLAWDQLAETVELHEARRLARSA